MVKGYVQIADLEFGSRPGGMGGTQATKTFANGFGASVITGGMFYSSPGHPYEIAVLGKDGSITYGTPVTDDVVGRLNEEEANEILKQIQDLK